MLFYTICNSLTRIIFIKVEYIPFTLSPVSINERLVYVSELFLAMSTLRGNINTMYRSYITRSQYVIRIESCRP